MEHRAPNIRHLRAFREVARHNSIRRASAEVYLSQPAITQASAKLEVMVGVAMFDRRSEGMFVTEPGKLFLARVDRALNYITSGTREAARLGQSRGGGATPNGRGLANLDQVVTGVQLRAVAVLLETENFSLAARSIGISQPSLHRAARDIERLSGIPLFSASSRGVTLSPAAKAIAQHAKLAFAELEQGRAEVDEWKGSGSGRIVIGTMPLARTFVLPTAILSLMSSHPHVGISVIDGPYDDLLHGLRHGDIDLLIGALRDPLPVDDVVQQPLFDDTLMIAARADHPLAAKTDISLGDLADFPWIVPRKDTPTRSHFEAMFEGAAQPDHIVEASSLILVTALILGSDALTFISAHQIRDEQRAGQMVRLNIDTAATTRPIGITQRRDWQPTATQRKFLGDLQAAGRQAALPYSKIE